MQKNITPHNPGHVLGNYLQALKQLGFRIIAADEALYRVRFFDMGAFVFYAKACVWEYPDFCVDTYEKQLFQCQEDINKQGYLSCTGHRFVLVSQKQSGSGIGAL